MSNAGCQPLPEAGAQRTLEAVGSVASAAWSGLDHDLWSPFGRAVRRVSPLSAAHLRCSPAIIGAVLGANVSASPLSTRGA
jgi:hypothetical protein